MIILYGACIALCCAPLLVMAIAAGVMIEGLLGNGSKNDNYKRYKR